MTKAGCDSGGEKKLKWWQLSMIGIGCIIGTGFFLGSSIAIKMTGPSVLISFIIAATGTYLVFDALSKLAASDPQKGSFCAYANQAFGRWARFSCGWTYWCSELLIMGSQLTALSIFARFWFPSIPMWVFASGFGILGIIVLLIGTKGFDKLEGLFAVTKVAAILMFIIIALLALFGVIHGGGTKTRVPNMMNEFFPHGFRGLWSSLIYAFYAFGGIEIMGIMAIRLKNKEDAPKSGKLMLLLLTIIYIISVGLAVILVPLSRFNTKESPFVVALDKYHLPMIPDIFNAALIVAGFSTMVASLFAVTSILMTLSEDGDAPKAFSMQGKLKVPIPSLFLTILVLGISIFLALLMPGKIYEYVTTGAGLMLLYNWSFILLSSQKLSKPKTMETVKRWTGILLIALAVSGTLFEKATRPGFYISLAFVGVIGAVAFLLKSFWDKEIIKSHLD
ncbi:L-asparagine transporter-like permease [Peribacillus deserti]|uniref:L-asparagine transporter-like permease n=1 Tax=Peribacillus deserti TaxID=673318 RepID=A0ABS2QF61_9BACI|nr:amino acid permease [Peribacillus deserti]MBM7691339.1 L-asparagine transporter-like permease [Peribacillus deserti]